MIKVAVLGTTGMLGHTVAQQLERDKSLDVTRFCRRPVNGERYIDALSTDISHLMEVDKFDYVINCIGLIKQLRIENRKDWFDVNARFPTLLAEHCYKTNTKLIQVSTDCVFSGKRGKYTENDVPDPEDDYGLSKWCGEPKTAMVIRSSVIGFELNGSHKSLLEWAMTNKGKEVNGYTNHMWNGLTSFEYANVCKKIMKKNLWQDGVFHVHAERISKYNLLVMINAAFDLQMTIKPTATPTICERSLSSVKPLNGLLEIPFVDEMIDTLARA